MTLRKAILDKLGELGEATIESFFPAKYPEAMLWRSLLGRDRDYRFSRRSFSALLSKLKTEGLVERRGTNRRAHWRLTDRGLDHLRIKIGTPPREDGIERLVIFDIPEREKAKRETIRRKLISIGYRQLQKSVWRGRFPLPADFVELLDALRLRDQVHIFSVCQSGTLNI